LMLICLVGIWHILQKSTSKLLTEHSYIDILRGHLHMEFL
jgi:hypothetical protein